MPPFLTGDDQGNWPDSNWPEEMQIPDSCENCPKCGSVLENNYGAIGGYSGHEQVHAGWLAGYFCHKCDKYFTPEELLSLKEAISRAKVRSDFARNYWKNVSASFKSYYLYLIMVCFMVLYKSFWAGIVAGVIFIFLLPFLEAGLEIVFAPLGRLVRKILPSDKPPDSPQTP